MTKPRVYSHYIGQNSYHLIFRTKYNLKYFKRDELRHYCEIFLREACERQKIKLHILRVLIDHVHLLLDVPPTMSISNVAKFLKGYSSREFFKRYTIWARKASIGHDGPHLWNRWKFFRTISAVSEDVVERYIQDSHHDEEFKYGSQKMINQGRGG